MAEVLVKFSMNQQCPETLSCGWLVCKLLIIDIPQCFKNRNSEHVRANLDTLMCHKSDLSVQLYVRVCVSVCGRFEGKPTLNFCGMQFQSLQLCPNTLCHVNSPQTEALNPRNRMPRLKQEEDKKIQVIDAITNRPYFNQQKYCEFLLDDFLIHLLNTPVIFVIYLSTL